jgi:hypothetical protein
MPSLLSLEQKALWIRAAQAVTEQEFMDAMAAAPVDPGRQMRIVIAEMINTNVDISGTGNLDGQITFDGSEEGVHSINGTSDLHACRKAIDQSHGGRAIAHFTIVDTSRAPGAQKVWIDAKSGQEVTEIVRNGQ